MHDIQKRCKSIDFFCIYLISFLFLCFRPLAYNVRRLGEGGGLTKPNTKVQLFPYPPSCRAVTPPLARPRSSTGGKPLVRRSSIFINYAYLNETDCNSKAYLFNPDSIRCNVLFVGRFTPEVYCRIRPVFIPEIRAKLL